MGKPAARMGDSTAHGGVIAAGAPTVLICGQPAARLGDMTTCPMVVPAPAPVPHVGGPIMIGSAGVLICGMPAARMGDQALCPPGGPAPIVAGAPTVLIGEVGASGGSGGAGIGAAISAVASAAVEGATGGPTVDASAEGAGGDTQAPDEGHRLDVAFNDKGGHPICGVQFSLSGPEDTRDRGQLTGSINLTGIPAGNYDIKLEAITAAQWSETHHKVGEDITLTVATAGVADGTHALLEIFRRDSNRRDLLVHTIESSVSGDAVEETWTPEVTDELLAYQDECFEQGQYSNPFHVFKVSIGTLGAYSSPMQLRDDLELTVKDDEDGALADREVRLMFPNGEIRVARTDGGGKLVAEDVPCGRFRVSLDVRS